MKRLLGLCCIAWAAIARADLADPLPVGMQETWFLMAIGPDLAGAERRDWQTGKIARFPVILPTHNRGSYRRQYAMAANRHGLWLAENTLALLRPDGSVVRLDRFFPEPPERGMNSAESGDQSLLIPLRDDSVLLLRKLRGEMKGRAFRLFWRNQTIAAQELKNTPDFNYGMAAVRLTDGRVLLTGGYTGQNRAWLFDPRDERWTATGSSSVGRLYPALAALPDGRAFIAGSSWMATASDNNEVRINATLGVELFDPASGKWRRLPNLPLSFRIEAYGANGPSAAVMPDGTLVLGGAMHRHLVYLPAIGKDFAANWRIADSLDNLRVGGIVQAIGKNEVAISGGRMPTANGQCCQTRDDGERLHLPRAGEMRRVSIGQQRWRAATAHRGNLTFVAGGTETFSLISSTTQASAVAELIDQRYGTVRDLPSLPEPLVTGKALWLDDDRILVKAIGHPAPGEDGRLLEFKSTGYLAVYSLKRDRWQPLYDPAIAQAELAGRSGNEVLLVDGAAQVWAFDPDAFKLRELPRPTQMRIGGVQRVLADGRIILAGGTAQSELMEAYDADCRRSNCPLQYFAYGPMTASRNHEIYSPDTRRWTLSAPSRGAGESAVIRGDGRVMSLGQSGKEGAGIWLIEQSDAQGKRWQRVPLPEGLDPGTCDSGSSVKTCRLLIGNLPEASQEAVLFASSHWDNALNDYYVDLWLFDDAGQWQSVARNLSPAMLATQKLRLRGVGDKSLYGTNFQPDQLRLSLE